MADKHWLSLMSYWHLLVPGLQDVQKHSFRVTSKSMHICRWQTAHEINYLRLLCILQLAPLDSIHQNKSPSPGSWWVRLFHANITTAEMGKWLSTVTRDTTNFVWVLVSYEWYWCVMNFDSAHTIVVDIWIHIHHSLCTLMASPFYCCRVRVFIFAYILEYTVYN